MSILQPIKDHPWIAGAAVGLVLLFLIFRSGSSSAPAVMSGAPGGSGGDPNADAVTIAQMQASTALAGFQAQQKHDELVSASQITLAQIGSDTTNHQNALAAEVALSQIGAGADVSLAGIDASRTAHLADVDADNLKTISARDVSLAGIDATRAIQQAGIDAENHRADDTMETMLQQIYATRDNNAQQINANAAIESRRLDDTMAVSTLQINTNHDIELHTINAGVENAHTLATALTANAHEAAETTRTGIVTQGNVASQLIAASAAVQTRNINANENIATQSWWDRIF